MVEKLKTLKDLNFRIWTDEETNLFANHQIKENLKQITIKWIKEEIRIWESRHTGVSKKGKVTDVPEIKRWMDRFNIKEEDLK